MALLRKRKKEEPVKQEVKKEKFKKEVERVSKELDIPKEKIVKVNIMPPSEPLPPVELKKEEPPVKAKYWEGVGIIGNNDTINRFRSIARYKHEIVGKLLMDFFKEYNEKNKF